MGPRRVMDEYGWGEWQQLMGLKKRHGGKVRDVRPFPDESMYVSRNI